MAGLTGVLGGTFDPPHYGHLRLAQAGYSGLGLLEVLWVVTASPPHKKQVPISPAALRLRMVQAAIEGQPEFRLSYADIERPAPHYSVDTLTWLREQEPDLRPVFLMGSDSLVDLPNWHQPERFLEVCELLGVLLRPGEPPDLIELEKALPGIRRKVCFLEAQPLAVSGSEIRRKIRSGEPVVELLPDSVAKIIEENRLYL